MPPDIRDHLFTAAELATRVTQADDFKEPAQQDSLKRLLMVVWRMLEPRTRRRFLDMLDDDLKYNPPKVISEKERLEIEMMQIIEGWPKVLSSVSANDRGFAMSIMKKRGQSGWWPSDAQMPRMRSMWAERSIDGDEIDVVEDAA